MSEYLVIRLGDDPNELAQWIAVDSTGVRQSRPGTGKLADAGNDVGDRSVIVLVPSAEVLTTSVDIPVKGAKLNAALPYALEEYLAEDVEKLHFAAAAKSQKQVNKKLTPPTRASVSGVTSTTPESDQKPRTAE